MDEKKNQDSLDGRWNEVLQALDARAGIGRESDEAVIEEFERTEPVDLSREFVDRVLASVARAGGRGSRSLDAGASRSWWERRAVLIPLGLVLLAGSVPIVISWSGRNSSTELSYEEALELAFDHGRPLESRLAAQSRLHTSLKPAFRALRTCAGESGDLGSLARSALNQLAAAITAPEHEVTTDRFSRGHLVRCLAQLHDPAASERERSEVLRELLAAALLGIDAMHRSRAEGSRFAVAADTYLGYMSRDVSR